MPLYELSERTERRVENVGVAVALGCLLGWVLFVHVLPHETTASAPSVLGVHPVAWAAGAMTLASYPAVARFRALLADDPEEGVTFEQVLWAAAALAFVLAAALLVYVLLALEGVLPPP